MADFRHGDKVCVPNPDGAGLVLATWRGMTDPIHMDHPSINNGAGYDTDAALVSYDDPERDLPEAVPCSKIRPAKDGACG